MRDITSLPNSKGEYQESFVKEIPFELDSNYQLVSDVRIKNILSQKRGKKG